MIANNNLASTEFCEIFPIFDASIYLMFSGLIESSNRIIIFIEQAFLIYSFDQSSQYSHRSKAVASKVVIVNATRFGRFLLFDYVEWQLMAENTHKFGITIIGRRFYSKYSSIAKNLYHSDYRMIREQNNPKNSFKALIFVR